MASPTANKSLTLWVIQRGTRLWSDGGLQSSWQQPCRMGPPRHWSGPDRTARPTFNLRTSYQRHWQPVGRVWSRKAVCDAAGSPDVQVLRVSIAANRMNPRRGRFRPTDFVTQSVGEPQQSAAEGQQTQGPTPFMGPLLGARRGWTPLIRVSSPRDTLGAVTFAPDLLRLLGHLRLNRFRDAT